MKLFELLEKIDESQTVIIADTENNEISRYNGRDSIEINLISHSILYIFAYIENNQAVIRIQIYDN